MYCPQFSGPATRKIDLKGWTVLPGIIESHTHPEMAALSERDGPVPVMHTIEEVLAYISAQAARLPPDRLIFVPKVYSTRLKERGVIRPGMSSTGRRPAGG